MFVAYSVVEIHYTILLPISLTDNVVKGVAKRSNHDGCRQCKQVKAEPCPRYRAIVHHNLFMLICLLL